MVQLAKTCCLFTVLPATVTSVEVDDRDATDIAYDGEFGDEMMDDD